MTVWNWRFLESKKFEIRHTSILLKSLFSVFSQSFRNYKNICLNFQIQWCSRSLGVPPRRPRLLIFYRNVDFRFRLRPRLNGFKENTSSLLYKLKTVCVHDENHFSTNWMNDVYFKKTPSFRCFTTKTDNQSGIIKIDVITSHFLITRTVLITTHLIDVNLQNSWIIRHFWVNLHVAWRVWVWSVFVYWFVVESKFVVLFVW